MASGAQGKGITRHMTDFRSMKRRGDAVTLTDEQVDELIALDNPELLYWFAMTARMSEASLEKMERAAFNWKIEVAAREKQFVNAVGTPLV